MDIVFQFGEYEITQTASNSVGIVAFISPLVALGLYFLKKNHDSKKEKKDKVEKSNDLLSYFRVLYDQILSESQKQADAYKEHSTNIKNKPSEFQILRFFVVGDLNRILEKLNHEQFFHSYIRNSKGTKEESINNIKSIFSFLDYLNVFFKMALDSHIKYKDDLIDKKIEFASILNEKVFIATVKFVTIFDNETSDELVKLRNQFRVVLEKFTDGSKNGDVDYLKNDFLEPLKDLLLSISSNSHKSVIENLQIDCMRATWCYNEFTGQSLFISEEFEKYSVELHNKINEFNSKEYFKSVEH